MQTINGVISATDKVAGVGLPPLDTPPGVGNLTVLLQGAVCSLLRFCSDAQ